MKDLSRLVADVPASVTALMMMKGRELAEDGNDIVNLAGGEPDFDTPQHITDAAFEAIRSGDTHYPPSFGTPALLQAIVDKLVRENDVHHFSTQDILVTPGGKFALFVALSSLLNPGDEVLILDPSWVTYGPMVQLTGGIPVRVSLSSAQDFTITEQILRDHVTPNSKVLMVNSPNNPTGRVLTKAEIDSIVAFAREYDLYVISDEIYEHILFDGVKHISLAAQPGMEDRTLVVNGFSKGYAMTGWRLGWLASPRPIAKLARTFQTQSITCAASFTMAAGVAALQGPQDCVHEMTAAYAARRKFLLDALDEIPGVVCPPVQGAFYIFPSFPNSKLTSLQLSERLLEDGLIATTPGSAFGAAGEGHVRFSFAASMGNLEKMVERLAILAPDL
jgi:aspartate aminotransferase